MGGGAGGCAIPQASATFSALDLMGYLIHPIDLNVMKMSFSDFLNYVEYFPILNIYKTHADFFASMKDDLRSIMAHRFSLVNYDITKEDNNLWFFEIEEKTIFNVSYFTKMTISIINTIYERIINDKFIINGFDKETTIEKMKIKIEKLKNFEGNGYAKLTGLQSSNVTIQTTSSLG